MSLDRRARLQLELVLCDLRGGSNYTGNAQVLADIGFNGDCRYYPLADTVRRMVKADDQLSYNRPARIVRARIALWARAFLRSEKEPDEFGDLDLGGWREFCASCGWHTGCDPTTATQACETLATQVIAVRRIWPLWESAPAHDPTRPRKKRAPSSV